MPDYLAIADNLAGRFAPAALPGTPTDAQPLRDATARLPGQVLDRTILVFPDQGEFGIPSSGTRMGGSDWAVRLYYAQAAAGSLEANTRDLLRWLTVLVDQLRTDLDLGGTVVVARVMGWRVGLLRYGGAEFDGLELQVHTVTSEAWTPSV